MDPSLSYIQHILCQDHYERNGYRDLRKLGRPLTNVVVVETNVWSTCIQRPNVVEVTMYPKPDLESLATYLDKVADCCGPDVRKLLELASYKQTHL